MPKQESIDTLNAALVVTIREEALKVLGITLAELAKRAGIPQASSDNYLTRSKGELKTDVIGKYAHGLGMRPHELMKKAEDLLGNPAARTVQDILDTMTPRELAQRVIDLENEKRRAQSEEAAE